MKVYATLLLTLLLGISCAVNSERITVKKGKDYSLMEDLTEVMRRQSGVQVRGQGTNAYFVIRGGNKASGSEGNPLFVVNGQRQPNYQTAYNLVTPKFIKSVTVLKDISDTAFYGVAGGNGVVLIELI